MSLVFIRLSMSSLHWLSCRDRVFWMGRVVERLGLLPSLDGGWREGEDRGEKGGEGGGRGYGKERGRSKERREERRERGIEVYNVYNIVIKTMLLF